MSQHDYTPDMDELEAALNGAMPETEQPEKAQEPEPVREEEEPEEVPQAAAEEPAEPDIDYDLEIPMPDGREAMTLGQMKDAVTDQERKQAELDEYRMKVVADEQLMQQFIQQTGVEIPQQFRETIQKRQEAYLAEQHRTMMKMIPEMAEQAGFDQLKPKIFEQAAKSNYTPEEVGQWTDPRMVHMAKRLAEFEAKEAQALETVEQVHKTSKAAKRGSKPRARTKQSAIQQRMESAKNSRFDEAKIGVIDDLLTG